MLNVQDPGFLIPLGARVSKLPMLKYHATYNLANRWRRVRKLLLKIIKIIIPGGPVTGCDRLGVQCAAPV